ncbi:MAG TPA: M35 family metallo-endopeptidase, partial [Thermoanaerobaculia bacterium]|nr:M35 family metallo-endopeptidase [Thermoanaerobaculia bacterium]
MFQRARVWVWPVFIAALWAAPAAAGGLAVTIDSAKAFVGNREPAVVRVTLRNDGAEDVSLLRWQTPLRGVEGNLFDVRVDGEAVAYLGRMYKRPAPKAEDYLRLAPGTSATVEIDLSRYYDMTRTGEYSIGYRVPTVESNVLYMAVQRDEQARVFQALARKQPRRATGQTLDPEFVGCSGSEQGQLVDALDGTEYLSANAYNYLYNIPVNKRKKSSAYKAWFGRYTAPRYNRVLQTYANVFVVANEYTVTFHCDCDEEDTYAYVYPDEPFNIHLCQLFWES